MREAEPARRLAWPVCLPEVRDMPRADHRNLARLARHAYEQCRRRGLSVAYLWWLRWKAHRRILRSRYHE